jgi:hypothetical protein
MNLLVRRDDLDREGEVYAIARERDKERRDTQGRDLPWWSSPVELVEEGVKAPIMDALNSRTGRGWE